MFGHSRLNKLRPAETAAAALAVEVTEVCTWSGSNPPEPPRSRGKTDSNHLDTLDAAERVEGLNIYTGHGWARVLGARLASWCLSTLLRFLSFPLRQVPTQPAPQPHITQENRIC